MAHERGLVTTTRGPVFAACLEQANRRLTNDLDLAQIAFELLQAMLEDTGAARGSVMLVNPDTGRLRIAAGVGLPAEAIGKDLKPAVRRISDWVLREGQPLVLNGEVRDQRFEGRGGIESALSLPLLGSRGPLGVLNLGRVSPASIFTPEDLARIVELSAPLGSFLERLQELNWAVGSWRALRNGSAHGETELHTTRRYELASAFTPAPLMGGDLWERVTSATGAQTVMLADVAGRGATAMAAAALTRGLFLAHARYSRSPAEIARLMNVDLCERLHGGHATLWIAHLTSTGEVVTCNAGFPEPLWIPIDGARPTWLAAGGPLAGVVPEATYDQEKIQLLPGDVVLAVSDGVLQSSNAAGAQMGLERVEELAGEMRRQPLDRLVRSVVDSALEFSGASNPVDDLAAMALRFTREE